MYCAERDRTCRIFIDLGEFECGRIRFNIHGTNVSRRLPVLIILCVWNLSHSIWRWKVVIKIVRIKFGTKSFYCQLLVEIRSICKSRRRFILLRNHCSMPLGDVVVDKRDGGMDIILRVDKDYIWRKIE